MRIKIKKPIPRKNHPIKSCGSENALFFIKIEEKKD